MLLGRDTVGFERVSDSNELKLSSETGITLPIDKGCHQRRRCWTYEKGVLALAGILGVVVYTLTVVAMTLELAKQGRKHGSRFLFSEQDCPKSLPRLLTVTRCPGKRLHHVRAPNNGAI